MRSYRIPGRGCLQPICVFLDLEEEILKPAIRITKLIGAGPDAELFKIVAHRRETTRMLVRRAPQEVRGFSHWAKREQIAQRLQTGKNVDGVALILRAIVTKQLIELEARAQEVIVVHESVLHAGGCKRGWKLRLPNALGQPRSFGSSAKML